jgi:hypothetical protein
MDDATRATQDAELTSKTCETCAGWANVLIVGERASGWPDGGICPTCGREPHIIDPITSQNLAADVWRFSSHN